MTHDPILEHMAWLQRVFMAKLYTEVQASERPRGHGMDSITAAAVGEEISRHYEIPLRVSWEWLMTLTAGEIAAKLASASEESGKGSNNAGN
ncbi:hypothetical protein [Streptomyces sp. NPDC001933]|uniref:hypothetical protein n=1 Tax=Streptomyces sp. NPDC001933 TaxID=3364626 RepID=UPI00369C190E